MDGMYEGFICLGGEGNNSHNTFEAINIESIGRVVSEIAEGASDIFYSKEADALHIRIDLVSVILLRDGTYKCFGPCQQVAPVIRTLKSVLSKLEN
jgi:hypothetical protein